MTSIIHARPPLFPYAAIVFKNNYTMTSSSDTHLSTSIAFCCPVYIHTYCRGAVHRLTDLMVQLGRTLLC